MNTEKWKSLVRHILTTIGSLAIVFGLTELSGFIDLITTNLDVWVEAGTILVGAVISIYGYWIKDSDRFKIREEVKANTSTK